MKPSSRFDYALRALVDLALHQDASPVTVGSIARRQKIPPRYLEQLFNRLRRQGLVIAERGPRGGYRLSRPASEIAVHSIFQSLEQPVKHSPQRWDPSSKKDGFNQADPTTSLWRQIEVAVETTLQATTLENLVAQAREQLPLPIRHRFTFHI